MFRNHRDRCCCGLSSPEILDQVSSHACVAGVNPNMLHSVEPVSPEFVQDTIDIQGRSRSHGWIGDLDEKMLLVALLYSKSRSHFRPRLPVAVIFEVLIRSPIYFCRNLLLLSSLSCSSLTASIRENIMSKESCNAFACLCICQYALHI